MYMGIIPSATADAVHAGTGSLDAAHTSPVHGDTAASGTDGTKTPALPLVQRHVSAYDYEMLLKAGKSVADVRIIKEYVSIVITQFNDFLPTYTVYETDLYPSKKAVQAAIADLRTHEAFAALCALQGETNPPPFAIGDEYDEYEHASDYASAYYYADDQGTKDVKDAVDYLLKWLLGNDPTCALVPGSGIHFHYKHYQARD
jgi:hypothetical protein